MLRCTIPFLCIVLCSNFRLPLKMKRIATFKTTPKTWHTKKHSQPVQIHPRPTSKKKKSVFSKHYLSWLGWLLGTYALCLWSCAVDAVHDTVAIIVLASLYVNLLGLFAVNFSLFCPTDPSNTFFFLLSKNCPFLFFAEVFKMKMQVGLIRPEQTCFFLISLRFSKTHKAAICKLLLF